MDSPSEDMTDDYSHPSYERLLQAAKYKAHITRPKEMADLLGVSTAVIANWKRRGVSAKGMYLATQKLGVNIEFLAGTSNRMTEFVSLTDDGLQFSMNLPIHHKGATPITLGTADGAGLVPIRKAGLRISAGVSGFSIDQEDEEGDPIFLSRSFLDSRNLNPSDLVAVEVSGESMEPTFYEGDTVVVNTADKNLSDGDVFALNYEGEVVIKRLRRDFGRWVAASDNTDQRRFYPKHCDENVKVLGRIVYRSGERF